MLNSKQMDLQSTIKIDRWIDMESEEFKVNDNNPAFTKKVLNSGFQEPAFLKVDDLGRLWIASNDNSKYFPLHDEVNGKLVGYRLSKKAAN